MSRARIEHDHYAQDVAEFGQPQHATRTRDGSLVAEFETGTDYQVRVYNAHGLRTRSDTAMDEASSQRWALGAIEQHGGAKGS